MTAILPIIASILLAGLQRSEGLSNHEESYGMGLIPPHGPNGPVYPGSPHGANANSCPPTSIVVNVNGGHPRMPGPMPMPFPPPPPPGPIIGGPTECHCSIDYGMPMPVPAGPIGLPYQVLADYVSSVNSTWDNTTGPVSAGNSTWDNSTYPIGNSTWENSTYPIENSTWENSTYPIGNSTWENNTYPMGNSTYENRTGPATPEPKGVTHEEVLGMIKQAIAHTNFKCSCHPAMPGPMPIPLGPVPLPKPMPLIEPMPVRQLESVLQEFNSNALPEAKFDASADIQI